MFLNVLSKCCQVPVPVVWKWCTIKNRNRERVMLELVHNIKVEKEGHHPK